MQYNILLHTTLPCHILCHTIQCHIWQWNLKMKNLSEKHFFKATNSNVTYSNIIFKCLTSFNTPYLNFTLINTISYATQIMSQLTTTHEATSHPKLSKMCNVMQHTTTFGSVIPYIALDTVTPYDITWDTARPYNVAHDSDIPLSIIFAPARPMTMTHLSASYLTALHIYSDTTYQHYIWPC